MTISRCKALVLSALLAGSLYSAGPVFAAEDAQAPSATSQAATSGAATTQADARKPDVVLNPGTAGDAQGAAQAEKQTPAATAASEDAAEAVVENEGDAIASRAQEKRGANLDGMRGDRAPKASADVGNEAQAAPEEKSQGDAESAAEDAAMKEAAKITKAEEEKPAAKVKAEPTLFINIDLAKQRMTVSEGSSVKYTWQISSGRYGYATPTGTFNPVWMTKMWYSRQYDNAPMPHSIFFSGGAAIHATSYTRQLGMPASHGCVRLAPRNAETLFKLVTKHSKAQTQIVVHGTPNYQVAERRDRSRSDRYAYRYEYGNPSRYWRDAPDWSYKRRYSTYYGEPPRYRYDRDYNRGYRQRGVFNGGSGYYGYGY